MNRRKKPQTGRSVPPDNHNGNGKGRRPQRGGAAQDAVHPGNKKLLEQIRQIISEAPEIRTEKVRPLQEAVEAGTYRIEVRKLANILITKLYPDP
jgi:anti-sigma28 factor (negative regulator of flagellin synthesis)